MPKGGIFSNPKKKEAMLKLRISGYSFKRIARKYNVDHTTVIYHCQVAGITLPETKRNEMYKLLKNNTNIEDVSLLLGISSEVVKRYIDLYGQSGNRVFSQREAQGVPKSASGVRVRKIPKTKIKISLIWWKLVRKARPVLLKIPKRVPMNDSSLVRAIKPEDAPIQFATKTDERGADWMQDSRGNWMCLGMSSEARKVQDEKKKKRTLELRRLQMLAY